MSIRQIFKYSYFIYVYLSEVNDQITYFENTYSASSLVFSVSISLLYVELAGFIENKSVGWTQFCFANFDCRIVLNKVKLVEHKSL